MLSLAHARHIAVILDYVMNHSAAKNPLLLRSSMSRTAPLRDWYEWADSHPSGWTMMHDARGLLDGHARRWMVCEAPPDPFGFASAPFESTSRSWSRSTIRRTRRTRPISLFYTS